MLSVPLVEGSGRHQQHWSLLQLDGNFPINFES